MYDDLVYIEKAIISIGICFHFVWTNRENIDAAVIEPVTMINGLIENCTAEQLYKILDDMKTKTA